MNVQRAITPHITVGDQPTESDLEALRGQGYTAVVNLRNDGEPEQPLSTDEEGKRVRNLDMEYLHYGVGSAPLSETGVRSVVAFLEHHAANKVLVHCRKGSRASALVLLHQAKVHGWKPDEVFEKGKALGLEVDGGLRTLVENYLKEHPEVG